MARWSRVCNYIRINFSLLHKDYGSFEVIFFLIVCRWLPCRVASRALTSVITSQYVDPYPSWGAIPELTLERWFDKFGVRLSYISC